MYFRIGQIMDFSLAELEQAAALVAQQMAPTPCLNWPLLSEAAGSEVWVKHENHTPTGAFKVRGGIVFAKELSRAKHQPEALITATRGNHGQSVPYAATQLGIPVRVLVPEGNSAEKNAAMRGWGAQVEVFGQDFDEARERAEALAAQGAGLLVPSFHEHLVRGVATYALELFRSTPNLKRVYVPIGMGSGICGVIRVRDLLGLETEIVGVVAQGADAIAQSFEKGQLVATAHAHTFADGLACRVPSPVALEIISAGAARVVRVSEEEIADAVRLLYRTTHNVAEGAGAAACAALMHELQGGLIDRTEASAVILTGGNIDAHWFAQVLSGGLPEI